VEKPARITDLAVTQMGHTLQLSFTPPALATDGERLSKPMEIEIFRGRAPGETPPAIAGVPWVTLGPQEWLALWKTQRSHLPSPSPSGSGASKLEDHTRADDLGKRSKAASNTRDREETQTPALIPGSKRGAKKGAGRNQDLEGSRLVYAYALPQQEFTQLRPSTYTFAARGLTRGFRGRPIQGDLSNVASVTLLDVSPAVLGLAVDQPTEGALELRWSPPGRGLSGRPIPPPAGYRIYKSVSGQADSFAQIGETAETTYRDPEFQFGQRYFYRIRAIFTHGTQMAQSEDSAPVEFTPHDAFPPSAPSDLTGIYTAGMVELIWNANGEPDLAGYNVYRRVDSGPAERINEALLVTPTFHDTSAQVHHTYTYSVTAVDLAHNESSPSSSVQVEAR
jgi:hypothetical protein